MEFVFALHLMKNILGITNELLIALQKKKKKKKNQDILNTMDLIKVSKQRLQMMRDDEWISLLTEVFSFCTTHDIPILNMDEIFVVSERPQRNTQKIQIYIIIMLSYSTPSYICNFKSLITIFQRRIPICYFVWHA